MGAWTREEMEGQAKTQARLGGLRVTVAIVLSIGIIALLGLVGNEAAPRMQSLLTAKNAAAISAHATYDSEQVTYGAQMRAMRHLKGELLSANADLSSFLVTGAKKKFDITRMIAMKELDQANHEAHALMLNAKSKLMNTAFTLENKKKRLADEAHTKRLNAVNAAEVANRDFAIANGGGTSAEAGR